LYTLIISDIWYATTENKWDLKKKKKKKIMLAGNFGTMSLRLRRLTTRGAAESARAL
jgi:hypothetical protein